MWGAILQDARRTSPDSLCEASSRVFCLVPASISSTFQTVRAHGTIRSLAGSSGFKAQLDGIAMKS
jgi:hypothetical protein